MTSGSPIPAAVNPLLAADLEWFRHDWLTGWSHIVYLWIVAPLLIAAGAYFTVRTRGVQFRRFASAARLSMRTGLFAEDHDSARSDAQTISGSRPSVSSWPPAPGPGTSPGWPSPW
ncbi:hypothetical protein ACWDYH_08425 [Nocardia goodfellowii]